MLFLDYMNLRSREIPKDKSQLSDILIDTIIIPAFIHPKLLFGQYPSSETIEIIRSGMIEVVSSSPYHVQDRELGVVFDIDQCIQEGLRKFIVLELDPYFMRALSAEPCLLLEISRENDARIELLSRATRWLACAYPQDHAITDIYHEVSDKFNRCLKAYKSSLVHH